MEVFSNIFQIQIPMLNNPFNFINSYLIKTNDGSALIDTGWNTRQSFHALQQQMDEAGVSFSDLKFIIITHAHPDHYGLVKQLEKVTSATLIIHELEQKTLPPAGQDFSQVHQELLSWWQVNGVPDGEYAALDKGLLSSLGMTRSEMKLKTVRGGEHLAIGDFILEILWTPGHTPGHVCLFNRSRGILFSGDHILEKITSNISMVGLDYPNPLGDYLNSLAGMDSLPVRLTLPAHGKSFDHFQHRIKEIEFHHEQRAKEIFKLLNGDRNSAYTISSLATWYAPWNKLTSFEKLLAVNETIAHLEMLASRGLVGKSAVNGHFLYSAS